MMSDGDLAMEFARHGVSVDTHPPWFGTPQQPDAPSDEVDAPPGEVDAPHGGPVELGALVDGKVVDTVYPPKKAVPKEQDSQVIYNAAQRTTPAPQRGASKGASKSPPPPPQSPSTSPQPPSCHPTRAHWRGEGSFQLH